MAIPALEWASLSAPERMALAAAGESSPLAFTALWFNVSQVESFRTNWHHHYFNFAAEQMLTGAAQNVVINIPPGGTKTEFFSVHLPVYCMVKHDRVRMLNTSYSKDLVSENSERARSLVKSAEFQEFYPFEISKDKVDDWTVDRQGKRISLVPLGEAEEEKEEEIEDLQKYVGKAPGSFGSLGDTLQKKLQK